jgi:hypothetical protein
MNLSDFSTMSTDELIQRFIDEANRVGTIVRLERVKVPLGSPEYDQAIATFRAMTAELARRKPIESLRERLFQNPSDDVRGWASMQLLSVDPVWASATFDGVLKRMTTKEVLEWRDCALRPLPDRPTLREMTLAQLVERFVLACERCFTATRFLSDEEGGRPSMTVFNKVTGDVHATAAEFNRRDNLAALVPLLDHPLVTVRQRAASYCLPVAEQEATATLQKISTTKQFPEFISALHTLECWRQGIYRAFPDDPKLTRIDNPWSSR